MIEVLPLSAYALVMSVTPGPNNMLLAAAGASFGFRRTLPHMAGIALGHALQIYLMCLGLGSAFHMFPVLHPVLRIAGAAYLMYLAWKLVGAVALTAATVAAPLSFTQAALFQFVNPKAWVMAITVSAVFLPAGAPAWLAGSLIALTAATIAVPCIALWTLFGVAIGRLLTNQRRRVVFNTTMGLLLAATAVSIAFVA